jgi:integrase
MVKKRRESRRESFTDRRLEAWQEPGRYFDTKTDGLGLRIERTGSKIFFWWRSAENTTIWKTLGPWPTLRLESAREEAEKNNVMLSEWKKTGGPNPFKTSQRSDVPTFKELVDAYVENQIRPNALNPARAEYEVRQMTAKYFSAWLDLPVDKITVEHVLEAKRACGKYRYAQRAVVGLARTLFNWCAGSRDGKVNLWKVENPAADVSVPKKEKRKRFLQPDELIRFNEELEKEKHKDLRDVLTLLLATGARKSNVYEMCWSDVSFERGNWHIPRSKSGESYEVKLMPAAVRVLERRRREIPESEVYVFPAASSSGHITDVKKRWVEFRKRCKFPDIRLHDIRRTTGSYLAISGVSLQQIGAVLGHKSLGSTEIYSQLHNEAVTKALETGDTTMQRMMQQAKKRMKPKQLPASR